MRKYYKIFFGMFLCIWKYHSWKIVVINEYSIVIIISWYALVSSVFSNAINYFSFKNIFKIVIYFSWKSIWEWKFLELVLRTCCNLISVTPKGFNPQRLLNMQFKSSTWKKIATCNLKVSLDKSFAKLQFYPAGMYLLKVNNRNTKARCEILHLAPCSSVSIVSFEHVIANWVGLTITLQILTLM